MGDLDAQTLWRLARRQHGVLSHEQMVRLGLSPKAIKHRVAKGKLHRMHIGVYAVGWPEPSRHGRWMAAVLAGGDGAALDRLSATALHGMEEWEKEISISVPAARSIRRPGIVVRRVDLPDSDVMVRDRIPVTSPARTLIDIAVDLPLPRLERAVNQADKLGLIGPDELRAELERHPGQRGVRVLRDLLDRDTFVLTGSELERRFLPIARRAGLPRPETGVRINGFVVDFLWRDLGLIVETDGLRYHRTELQQARDRRRDQAHAEAGFTTLRFTYTQVVREAVVVERTLSAVARRLAA